MLISSLIIALIGFLALNTSMNEKDRTYFNNMRYGQKVNVSGHSMNVCIFGENNNKTIAITPDLASSSPYYEFKPITEALSDEYTVVVIEPFGYGLSDDVDDERSVDNISNEIHTAMKQLGIDQYYLLVHSYSGLYGLKLVNKYPNEVLGFIGIDSTVPGQLNEFMDKVKLTISDISLLFDKGVDVVGITKLINKVKPGMLMNLDRTYKYTPEEIEEIDFLTLKKSPTKTQFNESKNANNNLKAVEKLKFPNTVPILNFLSNESVEAHKNWEELHCTIITETIYSEVQIFEGSHYLHLVQKNEIVKNIKR